MSPEDYPTPEADACRRHCVLNAGPASGLIAHAKMRRLERRLAFARETLRRVQDGYMRDAQRNLLIKEALKQTETIT